MPAGVTHLQESTTREWSATTVADPTTLLNHQDEVLDLLQRVGFPWSAMAHPGWVGAWWRTRSGDRRIVVCLIRHHGRLVASIPLEFARRRFAAAPMRTAETTNLALGWSSALIDPSTPSAWMTAFIDWLSADAPRWQVLKMGAFPAHHPAGHGLPVALDDRGWTTTTTTTPMASMPLPTDMGEFVAARGKHFRRDYARLRRGLTDGTFGVEHVRAVQPAELDDRVAPIDAMAWKGRQQVSLYSLERPFLHELALTHPEPGLELVCLLGTDGEPMAYSLGCRIGDVVHGLEIGHDPNAPDRSPGTLTTMAAIEAAIADGAHAFDVGDDGPHKKRYQPNLTPALTIIATRPAARTWARLAHAAQRMRPNGNPEAGL